MAFDASPNGWLAVRRIEYEEGISQMDIRTVGIDASKTTLEVGALPDSFRCQYNNDEAGIVALQADLLAQHG